MGEKAGTFFLIIGSMIGILFIGTAIAYFTGKTGDEFNGKIDSQLLAMDELAKKPAKTEKIPSVFWDVQVSTMSLKYAQEIQSINYEVNMYKFKQFKCISYKEIYQPTECLESKVSGSSDNPSSDIVVDTSKVNFNKIGVHPIKFTYNKNGVQSEYYDYLTINDGGIAYTGESIVSENGKMYTLNFKDYYAPNLNIKVEENTQLPINLKDSIGSNVDKLNLAVSTYDVKQGRYIDTSSEFDFSYSTVFGDSVTAEGRYPILLEATHKQTGEKLWMIYSLTVNKLQSEIG